MRLRKIDFTNPFTVRKWLKMLESDEEIGYLIKKNVNYSTNVLGFSINSNCFGLRGPSEENADNVILGTSYGMGFGVDIGHNWYEQSLDPTKWFNASLPVGPCEWLAILNRFYRGSCKHALFIYHPNFMQHGVTYLKWKGANVNVFDFLGWKTSMIGCAKLYAKKKLRERKGLQSGRVIYLKEFEELYKINATYAIVQKSDYRYIDCVYRALMELLHRFENVTVVRVGIKEQLVPAGLQSNVLKKSLSQYDEFWSSAQEIMKEHSSISFHTLPSFDLSIYNEYDTHWNAKGNKLFADYIMSKFNNFQ